MIDWETFAERVPAGTMIRYEPSNLTIWSGILLENILCPEEDLGYTETVRDVEFHYQHFNETPVFRVQDFEEDEVEWFQPLGKGIKYLINDQWLTFSQVMADAS